jgi:hypothetical protein
VLFVEITIELGLADLGWSGARVKPLYGGGNKGVFVCNRLVAQRLQ